MQILTWNNLSTADQAKALARPEVMADIDVGPILDAVRARGDVALRKLTAQYDGVEISDFAVEKPSLKSAWDNMPPADQAAMKMAYDNITAFHRAQMPNDITVETMTGVSCRRVARPIDTVGLYVPGGTAPLVSTMMMLAIPAKLARVSNIVITTPPQKNGRINAGLLACAYLCGVDQIYMVGGAQAIAALAYGTDTIPKVDKIFGPGNAYVAAAKARVSMEMGGPAIDLPAGPSEVLVMADDTANPVFVAADLLAQAEHDTMAQTICLVRSECFAKDVEREIDIQVQTLSRANIASAALEYGRIIICDNDQSMSDISNSYAPEHLIIQTQNPDTMMETVRNAGSVFLGQWTPESVGDYASGTNHTLPTYGAARAYSGVVLESFMKYISIQSLTREGLQALGPAVERLSTLEGLDAHGRAVTYRLQNIRPQ